MMISLYAGAITFSLITASAMAQQAPASSPIVSTSHSTEASMPKVDRSIFDPTRSPSRRTDAEPTSNARDAGKAATTTRSGESAGQTTANPKGN